MVARKDRSALFEIIHKDGPDADEQVKLPSWYYTDNNPGDEAERAASRPNRPSRTQGLTQWLGHPVVMRLPRATLLAVGAVALGVCVGSFLLGRATGGGASGESDRGLISPQAAAGAVTDLHNQPVNGSLLRSLRSADERGRSNPAPSSAAQAPLESVKLPADFGIVRSVTDDPRVPGLNYYRLAVIPSGSREQGQQAVEFLRRNGVDARLIPIQNNRSLKLVVIRGFDRPVSDPEARKFEQLLRALGRRWKADHNGSTNWSDLIPEKYKPGTN